MAAAGGVSVFPGWEFFSAVAGAESHLLKLLPRCVLFVDEPAMVRNQIDRWWNKVEQRHERSGIGSLIRPEDIYLRPEVLQGLLESHTGLDLDQLGAVDVLDEDNTLGEIEVNSRPTLRFHGSIPALTEQLRNLIAAEQRIVLAAAHAGRCGAHGDGAARVPDSLSARQPPFASRRRNHVRRSQLPGRRSARAGHRAHAACRGRQLSRVESHRLRRQRPLRRSRHHGAARAEAIQDRGVCFGFSRPHHRRLCGPRGARHRAVPGTERDRAGRAFHRIHDSRIRRAGQALRSAHAPRPDSEVSLDRHRPRAGAQQARLAAVDQDQGPRAQGHAGHGRRAAQALRRAPHRAGKCLLARQRVPARV